MNRRLLLGGVLKYKLPVGFEYEVPYTELTAGQLIRDGSLVNRNTYSELWKFVEAHPSMLVNDDEWLATLTANEGLVCNYYSTGDNSTTFRLPKAGTIVLPNSDPSKINTYSTDIQRNITGSITMIDTIGKTQNSAGALLFTATNASSSVNNNGNWSNSGTIDFDASRSIGMDHTGNEVKPKTITKLPVVQAISEVVDAGTLDFENVVSTQNELTTTHKVKQFTHLSDINLIPGQETLYTIARNLPYNSSIMYNVNADLGLNWIYPNPEYGVFEAIKANDSIVRFRYWHDWSYGSGGLREWHAVCNTDNPLSANKTTWVYCVNDNNNYIQANTWASLTMAPKPSDYVVEFIAPCDGKASLSITTSAASIHWISFEEYDMTNDAHPLIQKITAFGPAGLPNNILSQNFSVKRGNFITLAASSTSASYEAKFSPYKYEIEAYHWIKNDVNTFRRPDFGVITFTVASYNNTAGNEMLYGVSTSQSLGTISYQPSNAGITEIIISESSAEGVANNVLVVLNKANKPTAVTQDHLLLQDLEGNILVDLRYSAQHSTDTKTGYFIAGDTATANILALVKQNVNKEISMTFCAKYVPPISLNTKKLI